MSDVRGIFAGGSGSISIGAANAAVTAPGASGAQLPALASLGLTSSQRAQIDAVLQNAKSQGLTQQQTLAQIEAILTPAQQAQLQAELQGQRHHHQRHGGGLVPASSAQTDEFGIPTDLGASYGGSGAAIGDVAAYVSLRAQLQNPND